MIASRYGSARRRRVVGALIAALPVAACGELRQSAGPDTAPRYTYIRDVAPLLARTCVQCHGPTRAEGDYDLSSWRGLLGPGSDRTVRNAMPGNAQSLLLVPPGDATHASLLTAEQQRLLADWVGRDQMAYFNSSYHPPGWLYPGDRDALGFHGGALRAAKWDTGACEGCHGDDLRGGLSGADCQSCHAGGVDACGTCHGQGEDPVPPPSLAWGLDPAADRGVGAHAAHVAGERFTPLQCADCHRMPATVDAAGHLLDDAASGTSDLRAEVVLGNAASRGGVQASYDAAAGTCRVYCHGVGLAEPGVASEPSWTAVSARPCNACHAVPHAQIGGANCALCHQQSVVSCPLGEEGCLVTAGEQGVKFRDPALHLDGQAPLGKAEGSGTCWACHGSEQSAGAPAPDLEGNTGTGEVTVGLHQVHLSDGDFHKALACTTCHAVPAQLTDVGHIDSDRPAEVIFSDLASGAIRGGGIDLEPTWERSTATCGNVYCHSLDGGGMTQWRWTQPSLLNCGSCHGFPPQNTLSGSTHPAGADCSSCHAAAFSEGALDPAKHIDGKVDLQ